MEEEVILDLFNSFDRGYTIGNELSHDDFRNLYGKSIDDCDFETIDMIIAENGILLGRRTYFPYNKLISETEINLLIEYIEKVRNNHCSRISLLRIYDDLYDELFINTRIDRNSSHVIGIILERYCPNTYIIENNEIIFDNDSGDAITELLLKSGQPLSLKEIQNSIIGLDKDQVEIILKEKTKRNGIIMMSNGHYWHIDCFHIDEKLSNRLDKLLSELFEIRESISLDYIYNEIEDQLGQPGILNSEYEIEDSKCLGNIVLQLYPNYNIRSGNLVKIKTRDQSAKIIEELEEYEKFTSELYDNLMKKYGFQQWFYLDEVLQYYVRIDEDTFVKKEYASFDPEEIDGILETIMVTDYCPLKRITTFSGFPELEFPWNSYMLCSYLLGSSKLFSINFATGRVPKNFNGVIVKKGVFNNFDEICINAIADSKMDLESVTEEEVGNYLKNEGFLSRVRKGTIKILLKESKIKRRGHHV
jgi:hypothetical protein